MPQNGDHSLLYRRELSYECNGYAVFMVAINHFKQEEIVGHVTIFLSKTLNKFLRLPGSHASCKVTGTRKNKGIDVRLEIPIDITFIVKETVTELHCIA